MKVGEIAKIKKGYKFGGTLCRVVDIKGGNVWVTFSRYQRGATKDYTIELSKEAVE